MAGAGAQAATPPPSPEAYTPTGFAVRVLCDSGHPLGGLFVVWSERPPEKGAARGSGTPEADIMKVADAEAPPPGRFAAGFVDRAGYLQPMFLGVNPWLDIATDRRPQTFKLEPDHEYPFILLRHPSADLARKLAVHLNLTEPRGEFDFARWGGTACFGGDGATPESLVKARKLATVPPAGVKAPEKGKELYLVVNEGAKPADFWPKGHALYNEWTLYLGMPNSACPRVAEEVERLQKHLGILRYPVGIQERPYWPELRTEKLKTGNLGILEMRTAAALVRFQEHAAEGRAFKLAPDAVKEVHGALLQGQNPRQPVARYAASETWACLLGREIGRKRPGGEASGKDGISPEIEEADVLAGHAWGVADAATGKALEHWLKSGYRKPGKILLRVQGPPGSFIYLREEAAVQLEAWRQALLAFGVEYPKCPYGMPSGHSFRDISGIARGVAGVLNNSIHKTGLAIDFWIASTTNDTDFTRPAPGWPIRMEQRFDKPAGDPAAVAKRRIAGAEKDRRAATEQRQKDAKDPGLTGGSSELAGATPAATADEARARFTLARGKAAAARRAKAPAARARTLAEDDAAIAALDVELDLLKKEVDRIEKEVAKTKSAYRMRFCLYGHSKLDVFGAGSKDALKKLLGAVEGLPRALEAHLAEAFPSALRELARGWVRDVAFGRYVDPNLKSRLPDAPELIVQRLFRLAIRPFLFNPMEPDGGTSWDNVLVANASGRCPAELKPKKPGEREPKPTAVADHGVVHGNLQPYSGDAASYVNLSALGHHFDMFGIGTAGSSWKQALATLDVSTAFPDVAAKIEAAAKDEDAKLEDVVVKRGKLVIARLKPEKLDVAFLKEWAATLGDLAVVTAGGKKKPSACFRVKGSRLVARLAPPELASDGDRLVPLLEGKLANGRFVVVDAGKESGLLALPKAGALEGSKLAAELKAAAKAFKERVEEHRKAAEEAKKAGKGGAREKPKPAPPDLAKRDRTWFEVTLQPLLESKVIPAPDLGNVILQPGDVVQVPAPGIPRTLEWWHHQSLVARGGSWEDQVQEVGFSTRILRAGDPPAQDGGDWDGRGIGYTQGELTSKDGGLVALSEPSNVWEPPPPGW